MRKRGLFVAIWAAVATSATLVGLTAVNMVQDAVLGTQGVTALTSTEVSQELLARATHSSTTPTVPVGAPTADPLAISRPSGKAVSGTSSVRPTPSPTQGSAAITTPSASPDPTTTPSHTATPSSAPEATHSPTPRPSPSSTSALVYSTGGYVVAQCTLHQVRLVSSSPAQGYSLKSAGYGPAPQIQIVFRSNGDGAEVELEISCHDGTPAEDGGDASPDQ